MIPANATVAPPCPVAVSLASDSPTSASPQASYSVTHAVSGTEKSSAFSSRASVAKAPAPAPTADFPRRTGPMVAPQLSSQESSGA